MPLGPAAWCRRKSGWGGYGPAAGVARGARVVLLRRGESAAHSETWLRLEDGSRLDQSTTPPRSKLDTLQHTCISDGGVLGWVGWSKRAARLSVAGVLGGAMLAMLSTAVALIWLRQRPAQQCHYQQLPAGGPSCSGADQQQQQRGGSKDSASPPAGVPPAASVRRVLLEERELSFSISRTPSERSEDGGSLGGHPEAKV